MLDRALNHDPSTLSLFRPELMSQAGSRKGGPDELHNITMNRVETSASRELELAQTFAAVPRKQNLSGASSEEDDVPQSPDCRVRGQQPNPLPTLRPPRRFACPFRIHNRAAYMDCSAYHLKRVSDVRTHIERKHMQPIHCPRCGVIFEKRDILTEHLRDTVCSRKEPFHYPGVSLEQIRMIATRKHAKSDVEKWWRIWDILFPSSPRPLSPFDEGEPAETLRILENYVKRKLPSLLAPRLGPNFPPGVLGAVLSELGGAVDQCFGQFNRENRTSSPAGTLSRHNCPDAKNQGPDYLSYPLDTVLLSNILSSYQPNDDDNMWPSSKAPGQPMEPVDVETSHGPLISVLPRNEGHGRESSQLPPSVAKLYPVPSDQEVHTSDIQTKVSMPAPTRKRRPASNLPTHEAWERSKGLIQQLYIHESRTLEDVMEIMKMNHNFQAT
ncbi:hypothetical protein GGS26DRAFT_576933 [Hypomontagnella submonticulosa]|nr:hypothetical protein GGS26DRAFT_576933 [Hypomontagnella submonticulosa]